MTLRERCNGRFLVFAMISRVLVLFCVSLTLFSLESGCTVTLDEDSYSVCETHSECGDGWVCVCAAPSDSVGVCKSSGPTFETLTPSTSNPNGCFVETGFSDAGNDIADVDTKTPADAPFDAPFDMASENDVSPDTSDTSDTQGNDSKDGVFDPDDSSQDVDLDTGDMDVVLDPDDSSQDARLDTGDIKCEEGENCDDQNPCTQDRCTLDGGCDYLAIGGPCDDGIECTTNDYCEDGQCQAGTPVDCDGEPVAPCTTWVCDPVQDCISVPSSDGEPCGTGNACSAAPKCVGGLCIAQPIVCDDGVACTEDGCDPVLGCQNKPMSALCDDANPCTTDACLLNSGCTYSSSSGPCDDKNACTDNDLCTGTTCVGGAQKNCNDGNVCTKDTCDPTQGCKYTNVAAVCDDGNECTGTGSCLGGVCKSQTTISCNDQNSCTTDTCDPKKGCVFTNNTLPCDDGSACTIGDKCSGGTCAPGTAAACDDNNNCTADTCVPTVGCVHTAVGVSCNDGNQCTEGDQCSGGTCLPGKTPKDCDDNNICTLDSCSPDTGCKHAALQGISCNDGNQCTEGDQCSGGKCVPGKTPKNCNDENVCTSNTCDAAIGCVFVPLSGPACDDNDACSTGDFCANGVCKSGPGISPNAGCPGVLASSPVCEISGVINTTVDCPLMLAAASATEELCTGLQFTLSFDNTKVHLVNFFDEACFPGIGCFPVAVTGSGAFPLSAGQSVSIAPKNVEDWNKQVPCSAASPCYNGQPCTDGVCPETGGFGGVVIVNLSDPTKPISTAVLDTAGNVSGDPQFMVVRFKLVADVDAQQPVLLTLASAIGANKYAVTLDIIVEDTLLISSKSGGP